MYSLDQLRVATEIADIYRRNERTRERALQMLTLATANEPLSQAAVDHAYDTSALSAISGAADQADEDAGDYDGPLAPYVWHRAFLAHLRKNGWDVRPA